MKVNFFHLSLFISIEKRVRYTIEKYKTEMSYSHLKIFF